MLDLETNLKKYEECVVFLDRVARKYGFYLKEEQIKKEIEFLRLLYVENKKYNLTSIIKFEDMVYKHIIDSLFILKAIEVEEIDSFMDVGAGAGFPSIPIMIVKKFKRAVQIDCSRKRTEFLKLSKQKLKIDVDILCDRAEQASKNPEYREKFKIVTARAVSKLNILSELCLPYVEIGGFFVSLKGPEYLEDLKEGETAIRTLGGLVEKIENFKIEDNVRNIIVIKKISHTSTKYPRSFAKISKNPI